MCFKYICTGKLFGPYVLLNPIRFLTTKKGIQIQILNRDLMFGTVSKLQSVSTNKSYSLWISHFVIHLYK